MSRIYSDPTANAAIGHLDKELDRMRDTVKRLRQLRKDGLLTPDAQARARSRFATALVRKRFDAAMAAPDLPEEADAEQVLSPAS